MRAGRAVGVDDALAQQIVDGLARLRVVGAEQIVEGVVFADVIITCLIGVFGESARAGAIVSAHSALVARNKDLKPKVCLM